MTFHRNSIVILIIDSSEKGLYNIVFVIKAFFDMKILYITNYHDISLGGDSRVSWELARECAKRQENDVWILRPGEEFKITRDNISKELMVYDFPSSEVMYEYSFLKPSLLNMRRIFRLLDELAPDIIHSHFFSPIAFICQSWSLKQNIPFVFTSHFLASSSLDFQGTETFTKLSKLIKVPYNMYIRSFFNFCDSIITLNDNTKKDYEEFTKRNIRFDVIPNGVDLGSVNEDIDHIDKFDGRELIFAGHLSKRKNQRFLIDSLNNLSHIKRITLKLAGNFMDEEYEIATRKAVKDLNKKHNVELLGFVQHTDLMSMYSRSTYLVSASLMEVQSLVILEALASGLPVICLRNETTDELIIDGYNGFIIGKDSSEKDFASLIEKAFEVSTDEYVTLCYNARKTAQRFDWSNVVDETISLYKQLIPSKRIIDEKAIGFDRILKILNIQDDSSKDEKQPLHEEVTPRKRSDFLIISFVSSVILIFLAVMKVLSIFINRKEQSKE